MFVWGALSSAVSVLAHPPTTDQAVKTACVCACVCVCVCTSIAQYGSTVCIGIAMGGPAL